MGICCSTSGVFRKPHDVHIRGIFRKPTDADIRGIPEYRVVTEVVTGDVTGGCDTENPCGSSSFSTVTTRNNPMEEIIQEPHSPPSWGSDGDSDICINGEGGNSGSKKVCGHRVVTPGEKRNSAFYANGLGVSQPPPRHKPVTHPPSMVVLILWRPRRQICRFSPLFEKPHERGLLTYKRKSHHSRAVVMAFDGGQRYRRRVANQL
jgi:hypothetical protein